jgi:RimJ/RimL family protein N-acetyltransferase
MPTEPLTLQGKYVRLEPLSPARADGLLAAAAQGDTDLYRWTWVPRTRAEAAAYIETAVSWRDNGTAVPFATIDPASGAVIGSTRLWNLERWAWPAGHPAAGKHVYDACEIGHTWLSAAAIRTGANTEAKLLMLTHAFETWRVHRVSLQTDARNQRSRNAIERLGAKFEGVIRAQRIGADFTVRNSARYSILAEEWPAAKAKLLERLAR